MQLTGPIIATAVFFALVLAAALQGLAASGHFPRTAKTSGLGPIILFGSLAVTATSFAAGTAAALDQIPWYAVVIGGGFAVLVAPLVLQFFPDHFVDGCGALVIFATACVVLASALIAWAIGVFH